MKKIVTLSLALLTVMIMITNVYAASFSAELKTDKVNLENTDEFEVEMSVLNIQDDRGLITLGGTLEYNKNDLNLVTMDSVGEWTKPVYNEANGKFVMDRDGLTTNNETVIKMTFKVNNKNTKNTDIILRDIIASNAEEDIEANDIKLTVKIENNTIEPGTSVDTNKGNGTITPENNANTSKPHSRPGAIPYAGTTTIIALIVLVAGVAVFLLVRIKMTDHAIKKQHDNK